MEDILKQILNEVKETKESQKHLSGELKGLSDKVEGLGSEVENLSSEVKEIKSIQLRMEQEHGNKITTLFDGYTLRGDQIERLQEHLDERLDAIQTDLSYVVSKVAQHDRSILHLNKVAK